MPISRMDLADTGSPESLVQTILRLEPNLPIPTPIEALCTQLDIEEIVPLKTNGFEGGLITDVARSTGIVLVNRSASYPRQRFTIGHELGHFLMPTHVPQEEGQFLCSKADLKAMSIKESDRRSRMEIEANKFSSLILIPPPALRRRMRTSPSLENLFDLAQLFDVSKEAMARAYSDYHEAAIAMVVVKDGIVQRIYRNRIRFPFIITENGQPVPKGSLFYKHGKSSASPSLIHECLPDIWINVARGKPAPSLYEQVFFQARGFALIMLWHEEAAIDDEEENDERTAKQRLRDRLNDHRY